MFTVVSRPWVVLYGTLVAVGGRNRSSVWVAQVVLGGRFVDRTAGVGDFLCTFVLQKEML